LLPTFVGEEEYEDPSEGPDEKDGAEFERPYQFTQLVELPPVELSTSVPPEESISVPST